MASQGKEVDQQHSSFMGGGVGKKKLKFPVGRGNKHQTPNPNPRPKPFALNLYRGFKGIYNQLIENRAILFILHIFFIHLGVDKVLKGGGGGPSLTLRCHAHVIDHRILTWTTSF